MRLLESQLLREVLVCRCVPPRLKKFENSITTSNGIFYHSSATTRSTVPAVAVAGTYLAFKKAPIRSLNNYPGSLCNNLRTLRAGRDLHGHRHSPANITSFLPAIIIDHTRNSIEDLLWTVFHNPDLAYTTANKGC